MASFALGWLFSMADPVFVEKGINSSIHPLNLNLFD
jgi:hypothetical protein